MKVQRLYQQHAPLIVACFHQVYGDSYANTQFYDAERLRQLMDSGALLCAGALAEDEGGEQVLLGHMAMSVLPGAASVEMGNTVVTPAARGHGVAWKVGAELQSWAVELGYRGFLHYPTTDHHIMQQHSVVNGFETGLMLGYIPADTDGQVADKDSRLRNAATIVYQAIGPVDGEAPPLRQYLPDTYAELLRQWCRDTGLRRRWLSADGVPAQAPAVTRAVEETHKPRSLRRLRISAVGEDFSPRLQAFSQAPAMCRQLDFDLADPGVAGGVAAARRLGYCFCGWLPGFSRCDVLRLQKFDPASTNLQPGVVNPVAGRLLALIRAELQ